MVTDDSPNEPLHDVTNLNTTANVIYGNAHVKPYKQNPLEQMKSKI